MQRHSKGELKPCPFCGGKAELATPSVIAAVFCNRCSAAVVGDTAKEAINAWNQRAERTCKIIDDPYRPILKCCSECYGHIEDSPRFCPSCGAKVISGDV